MKFSEKDIDTLLASVQESLDKAESLSKAIPPQDDQAMEDAPAMPAEAPTTEQVAATTAEPTGEEAMEQAPMGEAPAEEALMEPPMEGEMPPQEGEMPPQEGEMPPQEGGEEELAGEGEEAPLTDEELDHIYGSMEQEDRERHYMILRRYLQGGYEEQPQEQAMPEDPAVGGEEGMIKSEKSELIRKNEEMAKQLKLLEKAVEILAQPKRKAVTQIDYIKKNEGIEGIREEGKPLDKAQINEKLKTITKSERLTGTDRQAINDYCLFGKNESQVLEIIKKTEGGK